MSNALYSAWLCGLGHQDGVLVLAAATQPTNAPVDAGANSPAMLALVAIGFCVLVVWVIRSLARPRRLQLRNTPGRPNSLTIAHVLLIWLFWTLSSYAAFGWLHQLTPGRPTTQPTQPATQVAAGPDKQLADARLGIVAAAIGLTVCLAASLAVAAGTFRHGLSRGLGLSPRHWICDLGRAIIGYLAVLPVCVALLVLFTYLFEVFHFTPQTHPVLKYMHAFSPSWRVLAVIEAVLLAPLAEEAFFRGIVQSFFRRTLHSPRLAILLASAIFAVVHHGSEPQALPSLFALALVLGYNYERTGRLISPILIHAIFNAVSLAM
jgi:membrane protease YdiL (CAAX protease family)